MKKKWKKILIIFLSLVVVFYLMSYLAVGFDTRSILKNLDPVELFDKMSQARKFSMIKQIVINEYVDVVDTDLLLEAAFDGIMGSLNDKYSYYFNEEEYEAFKSRREGSFGGIGVIVRTDYEELIVEITDFSDDSPAEKAGLMIGDRIISADGVTFTDKEGMSGMLDMIKGEAGTEVRIGIYRNETGEYLTYDITREKIYINNTSREMIGDIGYIVIESFTTGVSDDFIEACAWVESQNANGLIVDIRHNGGGSLDEVINISDHLLGDVLITYTENKYGERKEFRSDGEYFDIPLAVLVDRSSASASELFAGAVKDNGRGILIGEKTFGKGIVQTDYNLLDGTGIKLTTKKYYLPSGTSIHGAGIIPDIEVSQDEVYDGLDPANIPRDSDRVLEAALEYLSEG